MELTDRDVTSFLKKLVELGGVLHVDETPDLMVRYVGGEPLTVKNTDGVPKPICLYGTKNGECVILNPFAEGSAEAEKMTVYYYIRNHSIAAVMIAIIKKLIQIGTRANAGTKKKKDEDDAPNMKAIGLITKYVGNMDDKLLKEFNSITSDPTAFMSINYNNRTKSSSLKCLVFNTKQREGFNVRVQSWELFQNIILDLLKVESLDAFDTMASSVGMPLFETNTKVLIEVYDKIADIIFVLLDDADLTEEKKAAYKSINHEAIATLRSHIKYLKDYQAIAKWCRSPSVPTPMTAQPTPWAPVAPVGSAPVGMTNVMPMAPMTVGMTIGGVPIGSVPVVGQIPMSMTSAMPTTPMGIGLPVNSLPIGSVPVIGQVPMGNSVVQPLQFEQNKDNPFSK